MDIVPDLRSYKGSSNNLYIDGDYGHYSIVGNRIIAGYLSDKMTGMFMKAQ